MAQIGWFSIKVAGVMIGAILAMYLPIFWHGLKNGFFRSSRRDVAYPQWSISDQITLNGWGQAACLNSV